MSTLEAPTILADSALVARPAPSDPVIPNDAERSWVYRDHNGAALHCKIRLSCTDAGKSFRQMTHGTLDGVTGWHNKGRPRPYMLYGLDRLAAMPAAPVILVEGEKTADAAALLFPDHVAMTFGASGDETCGFQPACRACRRDLARP